MQLNHLIGILLVEVRLLAGAVIVGMLFAHLILTVRVWRQTGLSVKSLSMREMAAVAGSGVVMVSMVVFELDCGSKTKEQSNYGEFHF